MDKIKLFNCQYCDKQYQSKQYLNKHLEKCIEKVQKEEEKKYNSLQSAIQDKNNIIEQKEKEFENYKIKKEKEIKILNEQYINLKIEYEKIKHELKVKDELIIHGEFHKNKTISNINNTQNITTNTQNNLNIQNELDQLPLLNELAFKLSSNKEFIRSMKSTNLKPMINAVSNEASKYVKIIDKSRKKAQARIQNNGEIEYPINTIESLITPHLFNDKIKEIGERNYKILVHELSVAENENTVKECETMANNILKINNIIKETMSNNCPDNFIVPVATKINKKAKSIKPNRRRLLNENEQKLLLGIDDDDD
jgi:hypothetical protein